MGAVLAVWLASSGCRPDPDRDLPAAYRDLPVPEARLASPAARARGRALFLERCALCHGERADGHGLRREALSPPAADFTDPVWRRNTTPRHVYAAIQEGRTGTAMPAWKGLSGDETWDLTAYLLGVAGGR